MSRSRLVLLVAVLGPFLWCFGSVLFQERSFGFRDAANYYYPLFEWESREWAAGRIPLWNPLDNLGEPVLADTTSSVLYPGKLIFVLPFSFRLQYHLYVSLHVLLAAATTYALARRWRLSEQAATLAALVYAFSGSVLFQYCNVVFLVGAAWLPATLYAADRMLAQRSIVWAMLLGAVLAVMTLGGDPQAAYHGGLLAALYAWLGGTRPRHDDSLARTRRHVYTSPLALLSVAAVSGACLAAVQILPARELQAHSDRVTAAKPRSVPELVEALANSEAPDDATSQFLQGIWEAPESGTHLRHVYEFSVGPWHLAELLWPNVFGRTFPRNERWMTALRDEGRAWVPSLYAGLLPLMLALSSWRLFGTNSRSRFLSIVTLLSVLASFGWYAPGWLWNEWQTGVVGVDPREVRVGPPVGGVYWLMVLLLPGYVFFRYPAKLLVVASLGMSLLAAHGWDEMVSGNQQKIRRRCLLVTLVSLLMMIVFVGLRASWSKWIATAPWDGTFGPVDVRRSASTIFMALGHTATFGLLLWWLLDSRSKSPRLRRGLLLFVTAVELCVANGWMISTVASGVWSRPQPLAALVRSSEGGANEPPRRLFREANGLLIPPMWARRSSGARMEEVVAWEHATLLPRHHMLSDIAIVPAHTTLRTRDWRAFLNVAHENRPVPERPSELLQALAVTHLLLPEATEMPSADRLSSERGCSLWREQSALPRAWIVRQAVSLPLLKDRSRQATEERTRDVFFVDGKPRDLRTVVVLEADENPPPAANENAPPGAEASCQLMRHDPQVVELEVSHETSGYLVLNEAFYPGWEAERITDGKHHQLKVYRANRLMRAVALPPGKHHVRFTYRPQSFHAGAIVSAGSWLLLGACVLITCLRRAARSDS